MFGGCKMNSEQQEKIKQRLSQMPKQYRATYNRAMTGKSRKAAMRAFCTECCGWVIQEVFLCTDSACPLYPYRPRSRVSQGAPQSIPEQPELKKTD
jgi:hypothetical protein